MFWKRQKVLDVVFPPLVFVLAYSFSGTATAIGISLAYSFAVIAWRLWKKQTVWYALGGSGGVLISLLSVIVFNEARNYFLPSLVKNIGIPLLIALSILVRKPIVALSSHIARGWPLSWYMHPQVYPAYFETTLLWFLYFSGRAYLQYQAFLKNDLEAMTLITTFGGLPGIALLLFLTYVYGRWRLNTLKGPSVEEFKASAPRPWSGQRSGF